MDEVVVAAAAAEAAVVAKGPSPGKAIGEGSKKKASEEGFGITETMWDEEDA